MKGREYADAEGYIDEDGCADAEGYTGPGGRADAEGYQYTDADGYVGEDEYRYTDADGYVDAEEYRYIDADEYADADENRYAYEDGCADADEYRYTDTDGYAGTNKSAEEDRHTDKSAHAGKKRRKGISRAIISVFAVAFLTFGLLGLILFGILRAMAASGEEKLRANVINTVPVIIMDEPPEEKEGQVWKEGWVRYNGKIYEYNENILTFLFMGIDKFEKVSPNPDRTSGGQADAIFLVVANPDTKQISLIGVNRDTMVDIKLAGYTDNGKDLVHTAQLAVQHGFGDGMEESCELTRDAVAELFYNLPIHGYVSFNMGGVAALNDALGGVELSALKGMTGFNSKWTEGTWLKLKGTDAFEYVHYRDTEEFESARLRLERQKQYLGAFVDKAVDAVKKDITLPVDLYNSLKDYIVTDISIDEITYLAGELLGYQFDGNDVYTLEGTTESGKFEEFYPDKKALKELILRIFYREVTGFPG